MCTHHPRCPDASAPDWFAAHTVATHPEQGWTLLCNGAIVFDDLGALLPSGPTARSVPPPARTEGAKKRAFRAFPTRGQTGVLPVAA
jgi:Family of unknown function (DUF5999)